MYQQNEKKGKNSLKTSSEEEKNLVEEC